MEYLDIQGDRRCQNKFFLKKVGTTYCLRMIFMTVFSYLSTIDVSNQAFLATAITTGITSSELEIEKGRLRDT